MNTSIRKVSRFGMRIAPPLFVAGIGAGSFSSVVLALHGSPRPLWAFLVLGAALASCLVCRGKSREARSISRALRSLPAAQLDGTTLWGEHATAILTIRCQRYPTQIELEQLCRSRTGRWFSFCAICRWAAARPHRTELNPDLPTSHAGAC
jgi:hypothetical protein